MHLNRKNVRQKWGSPGNSKKKYLGILDDHKLNLNQQYNRAAKSIDVPFGALTDNRIKITGSNYFILC